MDDAEPAFGRLFLRIVFVHYDGCVNGVGATDYVARRDGSARCVAENGDSLHGRGFADGEWLGVEGALFGWVGAVEGVVDLCALGLAEQFHGLCFDVEARLHAEGGSSHGDGLLNPYAEVVEEIGGCALFAGEVEGDGLHGILISQQIGGYYDVGFIGLPFGGEVDIADALPEIVIAWSEMRLRLSSGILAGFVVELHMHLGAQGQRFVQVDPELCLPVFAAPSRFAVIIHYFLPVGRLHYDATAVVRASTRYDDGIIRVLRGGFFRNVVARVVASQVAVADGTDPAFGCLLLQIVFVHHDEGVNGVGGTGYVARSDGSARFVAENGDSLHGRGLAEGERLGVEGALFSGVGAVEGVVDLCALGLAAQLYGLCFDVEARLHAEGGSSRGDGLLNPYAEVVEEVGGCALFAGEVEGDGLHGILISQQIGGYYDVGFIGLPFGGEVDIADARPEIIIAWSEMRLRLSIGVLAGSVVELHVHLGVQGQRLVHVNPELGLPVLATPSRFAVFIHYFCSVGRLHYDAAAVVRAGTRYDDSIFHARRGGFFRDVVARIVASQVAVADGTDPAFGSLLLRRVFVHDCGVENGVGSFDFAARSDGSTRCVMENGDGLHGCCRADGERLGVEGALFGGGGAVEGVVDLCVLGLAAQLHGLCFEVQASLYAEGGSSHGDGSGVGFYIPLIDFRQFLDGLADCEDAGRGYSCLGIIQSRSQLLGQNIILVISTLHLYYKVGGSRHECVGHIVNGCQNPQVVVAC